MNIDEPDQRFLHSAKTILDRSAEELDQPTARRLQRARVHALTAPPQSARWAFAGVLTTASTAVLAAVLWFSKPVAVIPVHEAEDLDVVTAAEHLEFYDEIDFYRWLADHHGGG